ncbi:hypothetical protein BECAL_00318 [Bellilinea caldifistulae]|uniref:Uncharacterized protein n=1 Tax=Bellilinea caldifistulae TaxID=360411 RepID=A0A0P6WPY6_9CHLR|nr:hypothetical protein [Bellilinea caldifistulae]KPL72136.1 hypothetical protein AC812_16275 [Bellilinea caldifistulae]GAP09178.1 hypothetical protein BECAL_00318 [Bellilinea caldifistulae]
MRFKGLFVLFLLACTLVLLSVLWLITRSKPAENAVIGMAAGLVTGWVGIIGGLTFWQRNRIRSLILNLPGIWQIKFILFATLMAMIEEAIAVSMTNLAPFFGVPIGQAYITASTDYWDVIFHHSVIVFFGWFVGWAILLTRLDFSPFAVFIISGFLGWVGEILAFGIQQVGGFAMWMLIYGLMTYLPAYCLPDAEQRQARPVRLWHYPLAFFLLMLISIGWVTFIQQIIPPHPAIHFVP